MASISLIVSVLDSHDVVRRQLIYLNMLVGADCELVLVDDGSDPSLREVCDLVSVDFRLCRCPTRNTQPWTDARARNLGARAASGDTLVFFDIDHMLSEEIIACAREGKYDKFHWYRSPAILDEEGKLIVDEPVLREFGWNGKDLGVHPNSFGIRRDIFEWLNGYDESFCGKYGGGYDIEFNQRYETSAAAGKAKPAVVYGHGYVFPDPTRDRKGLFHRLER